jgi:hypothetical protein
VRITELFGIILRTILSMVEKAGNTLHEPGVCCRVAGFASPGGFMLVPPGLPARIAETAGIDRDFFPSAAPKFEIG